MAGLTRLKVGFSPRGWIHTASHKVWLKFSARLLTRRGKQRRRCIPRVTVDSGSRGEDRSRRSHVVSDAHASTRPHRCCTHGLGRPSLSTLRRNRPGSCPLAGGVLSIDDVERGGGMHNDGLQVGLSLVALVVAIRLALIGRGWLGLVLGGAFVGLAGSVKQPGVLAGVGIVALVHVNAVRHGGRRWLTRNCWTALLARIAAGAIPALTVFGGISAIHGLGMGWLNSTAGSPVSVTSDSPIALVVQFLRGSGGIPLNRLIGPATGVSLTLTVAAMMWCWVRWGPIPPCHIRLGRIASRSRNAVNVVTGRIGSPLRLQAGVMIVFAAFGASLQPWYLIGPLALLASVQLRRTHRDAVIGGVVATAILTMMQWYWSPYVCLPLVIVGYLIVWRIPKAWAFVTAAN